MLVRQYIEFFEEKNYISTRNHCFYRIRQLCVHTPIVYAQSKHCCNTYTMEDIA